LFQEEHHRKVCLSSTSLNNAKPDRSPLKPLLKEKKMTGQRSFNLGDSEKPDLVFFLMGACRAAAFFFGSRSGAQVGKGRE
jgi:hypothetical protein